MEDTWVSILFTAKSFTAELAKDILYENNIDAVIINKQDSTYLFGDIEVYVDRNDAICAKHILEKAEIS
jgi:hypothetical protein